MGGGGSSGCESGAVSLTASLSEDAILMCLSHLDVHSLATAMAVSKCLRDVSRDDILWREAFCRVWGDDTSPALRWEAQTAAAGLSDPEEEEEQPERNGGSCASVTASAPETENGATTTLRLNSVWYNRVKCFALIECHRTCTACRKKHSVVPLLYGFPSMQLRNMATQNALRLGGDYLFENADIFMCLSCQHTWNHYPYLSKKQHTEFTADVPRS